ncbi:hypothetical protein Hanom_Chr12g01098641 [Helianthus anomalus]
MGFKPFFVRLQSPDRLLKGHRINIRVLLIDATICIYFLGTEFNNFLTIVASSRVDPKFLNFALIPLIFPHTRLVSHSPSFLAFPNRFLKLIAELSKLYQPLDNEP